MGRIQQHRYDNGLILLFEQMPNVQSAAMTLLLPAGAACEPADQSGVATVLAEMMLRGAGDLDAKAHSDALDQLGVHRDATAQTWHLELSAAFLGDRLDPVLPLLLDCVRRPRLEDAAFEPSVQLALQAIESLEDEPQEKVMLELKQRHLGQPLGRSTLGRMDDLRKLTVQDVRAFDRQRFVPGGAILSLAGRLDFDHVRDKVGQLLDDWQGAADLPSSPALFPPRDCHHITADSAQQHIGVAYDTIGARDERSMLQQVATAALSGGMSGRLFTHVREERGLCYAVYASYAPQPEFGTMYAYAGTTPQRAAETLEVLTGELRRLGDGVDADEFERARIGLKSRVVMQGESTSARAAAMAWDQFRRGYPRTLEQISAEVDAVTPRALNDFLAEQRPSVFSTLTIGPEPLLPQAQDAPAAASS